LFRKVLTIPGLSRITLVTFNHDLVLENVLVELPYTKRWCVDEGYGPVTLSPTRSAHDVKRLPRHDEDCDHSIPIDLLKLHGSLNWQVVTRAHETSYHDLFPPSTVSPAMECIIDRVPNVSLQRRRRDRRAWKLWPQIVPPIYGKQQVISNRFAYLWGQAADRLRYADRLVIVGYSMPFTDVHTEEMLSRCISSNPRLSAVEVVNPDPVSAQRFADITSAERLTWYRDLAYFRP
jgi:hypothetical protein